MILLTEVQIELMEKERLDVGWNPKRPAEVMEQELESEIGRNKNGTQRRSK